MIYLIFGKDTFRAREKLAEIKAEFVQKTGSDFEISVLDETASIEKIKAALTFSSLLTSKKLIIFQKFISKGNSEAQKEVIKLLTTLPDFIGVVFVEIELKQDPLLRKIKSLGQVFQFEPLSYLELLSWIKKKIAAREGEIHPEAVKTLAFFVGPNLWRMETEIDKLLNFKDGIKILPEDVRELVRPEFSPRVFSLIDEIAAKNLKRSQNILRNLMDAGENPLYIHSIIVWQFRNLIIVETLNARGLGAGQIRAKTGLHPFVIQKSLQQIRNFSFPDLKKIYAKLLDVEIAIKTGRIQPRLALELLVTALLG